MDRRTVTRHLAQAEDHVAQGERHIARQHEIIAELERDGHETVTAVELLHTFEVSLAAHVAHRDKLRADLVKPGDDI